MAQLQRIDARLDTLSTELYQVNVRVGCIARQQATMGGFASEPTPSPPYPVAFDSDAENCQVLRLQELMYQNFNLYYVGKP